ncbi:MAG: hypothetical protein NWF05_07615 [Candidatus Bathyarchaeota archaeon]|nr:hypothetical protein [Candidatus Bathyarchaeota archaeon]
MPKQTLKIGVILAVALLAFSQSTLPTAFAEQSVAQELARTFIEEVLPVDLSKYQITFIKHSTLEVPNDSAVDTVRYTLSSKESTFDVSFNIENGAVRYCQVTEKTGSIISDKRYVNLLDAVKGFFEKYQNYSKIDSTHLLDMLNDVDLTKNTTSTIGNIRLTVSNLVWAGMDLTEITWVYTVNGADYTSLQLILQKDGTLRSFRDERVVYTIGDTSINISREQAIEIALKNLSTYSYEMPDHTVIRDFNVTEDQIITKLATTSVNSVLRPYWDIRMPLNQTYPGSVKGITAFIWANTGDIITYGNVAFGGVDYSENSDSETTTYPETEISPSSSEETPSSSPAASAESNPSSPDTTFAICITLAIAFAVASAVLIKKTKK